MDLTTLRLTETLAVANAFRSADAELMVQLSRLGNDECRQALVRHLATRFERLAARHDGLQVLIEHTFHRDFAIEEIRTMTIEARSLAAEVKRVIDELEGPS